MTENNPQSNNASFNNQKKTTNNFFRIRNRFPRKGDHGPRQNSISFAIPTDASSSSNEPISFQIGRKKSPYSGWQLYFPEVEYKDDLPIVRKINAFEQHIKKFPRSYKLNDIRQNMWFTISVEWLKRDQEFCQAMPNFLSDLNTSSMEMLMCAGLAAHHLIQIELLPMLSQGSDKSEISMKLSMLPIRARITDHSPIVNLSALKQDIYNCLFSVRGTVVRVNPPSLKCSWIAFRCTKCKTEQAVRQTNLGRSNMPISCKSSNCHNRSNFHMLQKSPFTRTEPYQMIRLQESVQSGKGQIPKTIEIDLDYDLVDSVSPGDQITVTGIMRVRTQANKQGTEAGLHSYYIHAVSIISNKNIVSHRNLDINDNDINIIKTIASEPNIFKILVHSLCPRIFGHEMVKAGLLLSLFGASGNGSISDQTPGYGKRAEIHVLVVGDPGLGKSLLIQACSNVSPRGIFVCGHSSTNAGLTVSIRHDKGSDGSLEAGALVLADQGVCCLDEFDKMSSNYQSLLQVMEQQSVSVAKAGALCSLPARTSIIAAANPSGGHYNKSKTVSENLKIWPTLLSRFDLVFILLDKADAHLDNLLTNHIQALKANQYNKPLERTRSSFSEHPTQFSMNKTHLSPDLSDAPLNERLRINDTNDFQPLRMDILQKYILYARKVCFPTLSAAASDELRKFYNEMRTTRQGIDSVPVTTRQLEALIRLTQARARLELATEATIHHAREVLAILRYTMIDVLSNDQNILEMKRSINGSGLSHTTKVKRFLLLIQGQCKNMFTVVELKELAASLGFEPFFHQMLDTLNVQGFLIKRSNNMYKFTT